MMEQFIKPTIVVSKCLEFEHCRYDGSMISDPFVRKLKNYIDFIPLCPEMEIGLPSPRQALRIIEQGEGEELIFSQTGESMTLPMEVYAKNKMNELKSFHVDGFILKSRSPSCGMKDVKVYKTYGKSSSLPRKTKGFFGKAVTQEFGQLAIEDEGRLLNYEIREHFCTRIYTHAAFRELKKTPNMGELVRFHSQHKYLFMAYHPNHLNSLGKIVANHQKNTTPDVFAAYEEAMNKLLATAPNTMRMINVMLHLFGYFSKDLNVKEKAYFLDAMEQYRNHQIPQSTVMAILRAWVIRFEQDYLMDQKIFIPYPLELVEVRDSGKGI